MRLTRTFLTLVLALLVFLSFCKKNTEESRFPLASEHNINEEQLTFAFDKAEDIENIASLVVCRNGVIVAEDYFNGFTADSIKSVMSVTKTITSLLTGLAIEKGYITDINDPISKYLEGIVIFPDEIKAGITIEQMLRMSFGHSWNGTKPEGLYSTWASTADHLQYIIDLPLVSVPGTVFNYSDGASHLLSVIITRATGVNTLDFATENLFDPLGITHFFWGKDDLGYPNGASSLRISPHDMVKIGNLILNKGKYNGVQVVPEDWIDLMTKVHISTNNDIIFGPEYGYQIWINLTAFHKYCFAMGWGGQFIFIIPDQDLVVTGTCNTTGLDWNQAGENWNRLIHVIVEDIFPSVN